jgi:3-dehydroquinate dehydratase/shikimate dehydrogenase
MLCVPIIGPSIDDAAHQIAEALPLADLLELPLDLLHYEFDTLKKLRALIEKPLLFTLRKKVHLKEIDRLASLSPTYFDLEYDTPPHVVEELRGKFPQIKWIVSYHNFTETPLDLEQILKSLKTTPADLYKIACTAHSTNDSLRMLNLVQRNAPLLGMCMGEKGEVTRILGTTVGSPWTFASLSSHQQTAPGQLPAQEMRSIYPIKKRSKIYGLIGNPITSSKSHFTHNQVMRELHLDAIYVKMAVEKEELGKFFSLAKQLGINGLSVTMPLKEQVIPYLDQIDRHAEKIGAVNTILFQNGRMIGFNTDGKGALDAIEEHIKVENKWVVILGAGGAARAIIDEAVTRGAHVCVLNRTVEKALHLAQKFEIQGGGLDGIKSHAYDLLINTTPDPLPISKEEISPQTILMDIKSVPKMTPFLEEGKRKNCTLIFGYEMFIRQAIEQYRIWFDSKLDRQKVLKIMQEEIEKRI